jgi:hypothetical protein
MRSGLGRPAVGSTVSCLIAASGSHTTAMVSVSAPTAVLSGHTHHAAFRTRFVGLSPMPTIMFGFSPTSDDTIFGSVSPSGPIVIDYDCSSGGPVNHAHGTLSGTPTEVVETQAVWSHELMAGSF